MSVKKKLVVKIRSKAKKKCPGKLLLDCPEESKVEVPEEQRKCGTELLQDEADPQATALKAKEDALKKQSTELKKQKQIMAIKRANQRLSDLNTGK